MFCKFCGTQNSDDFSFCAGCGALLDDSNNKNSSIEEPVFTHFDEESFASDTSISDIQPTDPGKTLGVIGMILSIVSIVMAVTSCLCGLTVFLYPPLAIAGFIVSIIAKRKSKKAGFKNGFAVTGLILSILALGCLVLWILFYVLYFVLYLGLGIGLPLFMESSGASGY